MREREGATVDDGYLASVSDLMVGLLFIFIIILMAFGLTFKSAQSTADLTIEKLAQERDAIAAERDRIKKTQLALVARQEELLRERELLAHDRDQLRDSSNKVRAITKFYSSRNAERQHMLEDLQSLLGARDVSVTVVPESGVLRLPEDMLFESAQAELRESAEPDLRVLAEVLARTLPCYVLDKQSLGPDCSGKGAGLLETVLIEGHTDDRPIRSGPFQDNWDLAARRGTSVYLRLTELQPTLAVLKNTKDDALVGVSSYEARRPIDDEETDAARRLNRRIDIRFVIAAPSDQEIEALTSSLE